VYFFTQIINRTTRRMDGFDQILNGLIRQEAQASDSKFTEDLTNHLFKFGNFIGSDLAARNIQVILSIGSQNVLPLCN